MPISANLGLKVIICCFVSILSRVQSLFKLHKRKHLLIHTTVGQ